MQHAETEKLGTNPADIRRAAEFLTSGSLVAFPTETVYGLGADATNATAVAAIFEAKQRPSFNPLIVHVPNVEFARSIVQWTETAQILADSFWPGPLTMVLPLKRGHNIASLVTAGLDTLAIRIPSHPAAQALLSAFGGPVAAPSANPSGRISPTTADHVIAGLNGRIAAVIDAGPCQVGLESTIIGLANEPTLLRPGGIATEDIEQALGTALVHSGNGTTPTSPGQLASHYAPSAAVRLNARDKRGDEVLLGFGPMHCDLNLSETGDLAEAAANLFDFLHQLDATGKPIAVAPIPDHGLGIAINDRLRRAAAPR